MEYKKAIVVLSKMEAKYHFSPEEKEAVLTAMGTLDCGSLAENRIRKIVRGRKEKRSKDLE